MRTWMMLSASPAPGLLSARRPPPAPRRPVNSTASAVAPATGRARTGIRAATIEDLVGRRRRALGRGGEPPVKVARERGRLDLLGPAHPWSHAVAYAPSAPDRRNSPARPRLEGELVSDSTPPPAAR